MIEYECPCGDRGPHPVHTELSDGTIIAHCRRDGARLVIYL